MFLSYDEDRVNVGREDGGIYIGLVWDATFIMLNMQESGDY